MKNKSFLRPNWFLINRAIAANGDDLPKLRNELAQLRKKVDAKISEAYTAREIKRKKDHEILIRDFPVGTYFFFIGLYEGMYQFFGCACKKIKDARKYITIEFTLPDGTKKRWRVYYKDVQVTEVTEAQKDHAKTNIHFRNFVKSIL